MLVHSANVNNTARGAAAVVVGGLPRALQDVYLALEVGEPLQSQAAGPVATRPTTGRSSKQHAGRAAKSQGRPPWKD